MKFTIFDRRVRQEGKHRMNNFFKYLDESKSLLSDDCVDTLEIKTIDFPENISGKEAREAIRFLKKEGVFFEEIYTSGGFTYRAYFRTKAHCQRKKLESSIRYWLLDYCLNHQKEYEVTVKQEKVISYSKRAKDCYYIVTIRLPQASS